VTCKAKIINVDNRFGWYYIACIILYARPRLNLQKVSYSVSVVKLSLNLQYRGKREIILKNEQIYINYQTYIYISFY
jgi:hypothetical protein